MKADGAARTVHGPRNIILITGSELTGRITGTILPAGADYQNLSPPATIDARSLWQTADSEVIIVRNGGPLGSLVPIQPHRIQRRPPYSPYGPFFRRHPK